MRRLLLMLLLLFGLLAGAFATLEVWPVDSGRRVSPNPKGNADRGAYLARMAGCIGCHTDAESGGEPLAGGPPLGTPFGVFYPPNITPDPEHGIGDWTFPQFHAAVHQGVSPEGDPYYPAFPYTFYTRMSEQQLADLWAAIWTVPPVDRPSPEHALPFPFDQRAGLKLWRALFFDSEDLKASHDLDQIASRGRFVVEGPGHCGACHTPRNLLGARDSDRRFAGSEGLPGGHEAPPITASALKAAGWKAPDLVFALRLGLKPDGDSFSGPMGEVVRDSTSWLSDADLRAVAAFLLQESAGSNL